MFFGQNHTELFITIKQKQHIKAHLVCLCSDHINMFNSEYMNNEMKWLPFWVIPMNSNHWFKYNLLSQWQRVLENRLEMQTDVKKSSNTGTVQNWCLITTYQIMFTFKIQQRLYLSIKLSMCTFRHTNSGSINFNYCRIAENTRMFQGICWLSMFR